MKRTRGTIDEAQSSNPNGASKQTDQISTKKERAKWDIPSTCVLLESILRSRQENEGKDKWSDNLCESITLDIKEKIRGSSYTQLQVAQKYRDLMKKYKHDQANQIHSNCYGAQNHSNISHSLEQLNGLLSEVYGGGIASSRKNQGLGNNSNPSNLPDNPCGGAGASHGNHQGPGSYTTSTYRKHNVVAPSKDGQMVLNPVGGNEQSQNPPDCNNTNSNVKARTTNTGCDSISECLHIAHDLGFESSDSDPVGEIFRCHHYREAFLAMETFEQKKKLFEQMIQYRKANPPAKLEI